MSYVCGIGPNLAKTLNIKATGPSFRCDVCGAIYEVQPPMSRFPTPDWFARGELPRGWSQTKGSGGKLVDRCAKCWGRDAAT